MHSHFQVSAAESGSAVQPAHSLRCPSPVFIRLPTVLALIPISRSSLWEMVRRGDFPPPVKLSARVTAWRTDDVLSFIRRLG